MSDKIRLLLADDHPLFRDGVSRTLAAERDMEVVAEFDDADAAVHAAADQLPDIAILDISMPGLRGMEVAERLSQMEPPKPLRRIWPPAILVLSAYCDSEYVYSLFAAGAKGYLLKDEAPERIVAAIRDVDRLRAGRRCDRRAARRRQGLHPQGHQRP